MKCGTHPQWNTMWLQREMKPCHSLQLKIGGYHVKKNKWEERKVLNYMSYQWYIEKQDKGMKKIKGETSRSHSSLD